MIPDWIYQTTDNGVWIFLLVTVAMGASAAWVSGRAIALTWRPLWQLPLYMLLLTGAVRFLHYALFDEIFLALGNFLVDFAVLLIAAAIGHRRTRAQQLATQYPWLFESSGFVSWRRIAGSAKDSAVDSA